MKNWIKILFETQRQDAEARQIARHLARVALYELKGVDSLYPDIREKFKRLEKNMARLGKPVYLVEGFRSAKKQNDYFAKGRTKPGNIITNAKGLQGYHQYCLAFDVAFTGYNWRPPKWDWWETLGSEGEKVGLIWGGSFQDYGHFEWHPRFSWRDIKDYFEL